MDGNLTEGLMCATPASGDAGASRVNDVVTNARCVCVCVCEV